VILSVYQVSAVYPAVTVALQDIVPKAKVDLTVTAEVASSQAFFPESIVN